MNLCALIGIGSFMITGYAFIRAIFIRRQLVNVNYHHGVDQKLSLIRELIRDPQIQAQPDILLLLKSYYWHRILKNTFLIGFVYIILACFHIVPIYI